MNIKAPALNFMHINRCGMSFAPLWVQPPT
jgi:hypothetical protein